MSMPPARNTTAAPALITSRANPRVKQLAALHTPAGHAAGGGIWVESRACVAAALTAAAAVHEVALSDAAAPAAQELAAQAAAAGVPVVRYAATCFAKFTALRHPDGIGAVVTPPPVLPPPAALPARMLVLWQLQDPGNQGSILRSAVALGCAAVMTVAPCVDVFHPLCIRATAGLLFHARLHGCDERSARAWLTRHAADVAVISADGAERISHAGLRRPRVLLLGNEARGVPADLRAALRSLAIPMQSAAESLNVNAAAAIALFGVWGAPAGA
jgi:TrmH family RNA methyltransferase